jgi:site-specific DNA recombinase
LGIKSTKMNRIVSYLRCSTSYQLEGHSIDNQRLKIKQYCDLHNLVLSEEIVDEGVSGKTSKREGYMRLLEIVENGGCEGVIVYSLSRFSRNTMDTLSSIEKMNQKGITFHSLSESIDTSSPNGRFFLTILSSLSQLEREITSQRVTDVLKGLKITNKPYSNDLYGWDKVEGNLVENKLEQKMLRKILKMSKLGYSNYEIAKFLNEKGYKTKRGGKKFYYGTIDYIVKSKAA